VTTRPKRSPIWTMPETEFRALVARGPGLKEVLANVGMRNAGGNHRTLKARIESLDLSVSHLLEHAKRQRSKIGLRGRFPLEQVMVRNSTYRRGSLKKRLIENGTLPNCCSECGQGPKWKGRPLVMVLDHINGVPDDHRKENLRLLCPNCNSQTDTFAGRKNRKCPKCGDPRGPKGTHCQPCANTITMTQRRKIKTRPSKGELRKLVKEHGYCGTGRLFGVSDNAIRKWLK